MSKAKLELRVLNFIRQYNLIPPGETIVVGVSGGADSVSLLHILAFQREQLGVRLHAAHLNHQLRGAESEADAEYVSKLAESLSIPITIERQNTLAYKAERNCSLEEAARELRYAFFSRVAREVGASRIAIGHTRDDQVETILMHLLRGTGMAGLRGLLPHSPMPYFERGVEPKNLFIVRPLLNTTRKETLGYCQKHQLNPRIDSSNLSLSFFRNRLRLHLLPLLREYNPKVDEALLRLADIAREDNAFIEQRALELWDEVIKVKDGALCLDKEHMIRLPVALQRQMLRLAIASMARDPRDIEAEHIEAMRTLLSKPAGKRVCLPHDLICYGGYEELIIAPGTIDRPSFLASECPFPALTGEFPLTIPGETLASGWKVIAEVKPASAKPTSAQEQSKFLANLDFHKTGTKLFVRPRQRGDRFQPLGMNALKNLSEFMVDAKIPYTWRDRIPLVCSPQQIVWVVGWRIDDRVKITPTTKEILHLEFIRFP